MSVLLAQHQQWQIHVAGESAIIVYLKQTNTDTPSYLSHLTTLIQQHQQQWHVRRVLPSYHSLLIEFNLFNTDHAQLTSQVVELLNSTLQQPVIEGELIELPVYYGAEVAPDLARIADHAQLSVADVISKHQAQQYHVYAIGFAPGFAYLGYVDPCIAMPRLSTPRASVAKGSVGIADRQTAVYPMDSPGGWNIIGRCPTPLFQPEQQPTMPFKVGSKVVFYSIDKAEFLRLGGEL